MVFFFFFFFFWASTYTFMLCSHMCTAWGGGGGHFVCSELSTHNLQILHVKLCGGVEYVLCINIQLYHQPTR